MHAPLTTPLIPSPQPECYYWAAVELGQRSILTGWLILIPTEMDFLRLVAALLISLAVLVLTLTARPYRRTEDNILATTSILLLNLAYVGALLVKIFEDVSATDNDLAQRVFGFSSTNIIVAVMLAFTVAMFLVLTAAAVHTLSSEGRMAILLLKDTRLPPTLSLAAGQKWMLFISHIWSTGQDQVRSCIYGFPARASRARTALSPLYLQAAAIKRQLQRMLPRIAVFLDVDECATSWFERYVACPV